MKLLDDELKSIRTELKKAIKGRPLYFALMAPGSKKGKFKLSKKKGDTKPADFKKSFNPYEDDKDNNLKGTACQGVVTGEKGVLTFHPQNKPPGAALKFLDYFILREVKFKQVKDIVFAEPSENLPDVPDQSPLDVGLSDAAIRERLEELQRRFDGYEEPNRVTISKALIEAQNALGAGRLDAADEQLDLAEELLNAGSAAATSEPHLASAPTEAADLGELQQRLNDAKEKAGKLPAGLLSNLASLITGAQNAISAGEPDPAEDAVIELEEAIDGAYQDFFLQNLRLLVKAESELPPNAAQLLSLVKKQVGLRNWSNAMTSFEELKRLLLEATSAAETSASSSADNSPSSSADTSASSGGDRESFLSRRRELEPVLLQAQKLDPENSTRYGAVWAFADEQAEAENYGKGTDALNRLEPQLRKSIEAADGKTDAERLGITPGIVAQRKRVLEARWKEAVRECRKKVDGFQKAIEVQIPDEDADELVTAVHESLDEFLEDMNGAVSATQASTAEKPEALNAALEKVKSYRVEVATDELIQHLKTTKDELGVDGDLESVLNDALDDIETVLTTV